MLDSRIQDSLKEFFLFRNVCIQELEAQLSFMETCSIRTYRANEVIQGNVVAVSGLAQLLHGSASVLSDASESGVLLRFLRPGDVFGAASLYCDQGGYGTVVQAKSDCEILLIPQSSVKRIIVCSSTAAENFITFLSERICFLNRKITAFTAGSAEAKLAVYLLGLPASEGNICYLPLSMAALADSLNMGRASLYRAFDSLEKNGLIVREGKKVRIRDRDACYNNLIE